MLSRLLYSIRRYCFLNRLYCQTTSLILNRQLPGSAYKPDLVEKGKFVQWQRDGLFKPCLSSDKPKFCIVLPPPNVTGKLHLGHALGCTVQDVIVRRHRSLGYNVLWVPGIDHAGIATQGVVEKYLENTVQVNRHTLGREKFNEEVWRWKEKHGDNIKAQLMTLGCSLDWTRNIFTMDKNHTMAVNTAFMYLFNRGLIYRKEALVNWCHALQSTVSDIEVETKPIRGPTELTLPGLRQPAKFGLLYNFAYQVFGSNDGEEVVVSTTMPETMLGDVAIAVHPDDERYSSYVGKRVFHPFRQITIPIIADNFVDMSFGTGAVKITPAHSKTDYEVAKKHNLPLHTVIDETGTMINSKEFDGLHRYECRERIVHVLTELDFMRSTEPHEMNLPVCSRTGDVISHLPKEQWFLSCTEMNKKARNAVESGQLRIEPERYIRNWFNWTDDDRDWCISRQLWWGHQMPAYKCTLDRNTIWISALSERDAQVFASKRFNTFPGNVIIERDEDVLDTWFSSAIYPFASLGWPNNIQYADFYPLNLMVTGHDILGFWVHRMVMLGLELTDRLPFNNVLLHGVICDSKGAKMSKSRGNVIDPMDVIQGISMEKMKEKSETMFKNGILTKDELKRALGYHRSNFSNTSGIPECGVDALRFTLLSQDVKSQFVNFDVAMCHANKLFCNKIWQSVKYVQSSCAKLIPNDNEITQDDLTYFDRWILSRLSDMVKHVNLSIDANEFHLATKALRKHIYNEFCDVYLEATKPGFKDNNKNSYAHAHTLTAALHTSLRCLSPFMVYLTDELVYQVPTFDNNVVHNFDDDDKKYLTFPEYADFEKWKDEELESRVGKVLETAALVRELKGLCGMPNSSKPIVCVKTQNDALKYDLTNNVPIVMNIARCCNLHCNVISPNNYIRGILDKESEVWVEILGTDIEKTITSAKLKLRQKIDKLEKQLGKLEEQYSSREDSESIPEYLKVSEKHKLISKQEELKQLKDDLARIFFEEKTN